MHFGVSVELLYAYIFEIFFGLSFVGHRVGRVDVALRAKGLPAAGFEESMGPST